MMGNFPSTLSLTLEQQKPLINYLFMFHVPANVDNNRLSKKKLEYFAVMNLFTQAKEAKSRITRNEKKNHEILKIVFRPFAYQTTKTQPRSEKNDNHL